MSLGQFLDRMKRVSCPLGIEIDKDIVEYHGKRVHMSGIVPQKGEANGHVKLFRSAPAQQLRQEPHAITALHLKVGAGKSETYNFAPFNRQKSEANLVISLIQSYQ